MSATEHLKRYFGYDAFREGQAELVDALLHGRDALGVMPTGAGKSLCYQLPSMLLPGVTLVISPLISLMRDQVQALVANGIPAAFLNSSLTDAQCSRVMTNAINRLYKIIYLAPERLLTPSFLRLASALPLSLIAVDEAHCISQWGQDFRPSYLDIPIFVDRLSVRPVVAAFTATATPRVRKDILATLELQNPLTRVTGFNRPNLCFKVKHPKDKYASLMQYLNGRDSSGIVYCSTRKEVERLAERLQTDGYSAARYHAGLSDKERSMSQDDFLYDRVKIIVATNAFGMGIDKSNVRFVIHYNLPQNVESYYQEAGRAGRDGLPADCILFYARKDINTALFLINKSENPDEIARNKQLFNQMEQYCETYGCLRRYMLGYFGEAAADDCGNCSNCNGTFDEIDVTVDAQKILSHILRLNRAGKRFRFPYTSDIILGKSEAFMNLPTFGIMKGTSRHYIRQLTSRLAALGYICDDGFLSTTPKARDVLFGGAAVTIRKSQTATKANREKNQVQQPKYALSEGLLAKLKELRLTLAHDTKVPAFVIFSDATLLDMCQKHPRTEDELLGVSGVGQVKLERYGMRFLQLLQTHEPNEEQENHFPVLTPELFKKHIEMDDRSLQISRVADHINAVFIRYGKKRVSGQRLNQLLIEAGYLEWIDGEKLPTDRGKALGITTVERRSSKGVYIQCLFGRDAQQLCAQLAFHDAIDAERGGASC